MEVKAFEYKAKQVCTRCIMDDTVKGITFDENGVCTFCHIHDEMEAKYPLDENTNLRLQDIVNKIKKNGRNKKYDCIVGLSGGKDSSYTLVKVVELGLRPLVVHFDNGWNSDHAVQNIKNLCNKLNLDLYTHVADWEEFKDLQKSFLFASVPDGEVPTDWVITSVLIKIAKKERLRHIIAGSSFRTEGTTPLTWTYQDPKYIIYLHKKFGKNKIKSFPIMNSVQFLYYPFFKKNKKCGNPFCSVKETFISKSTFGLFFYKKNTYNQLLYIQKHNLNYIVDFSNKNIPEMYVPKAIMGNQTNGFMFVGLIKDRDKLINKYEKKGIELGKHFSCAIEWAKLFGYKEDCLNAKEISKNIITIPTYYKINLS